MKNLLINILLRLLGDNSHRDLYKIKYLFGASSEGKHEARKKRWERALARVAADKDLLDYLYYQSESDKENAWKGKFDKRIFQGARIRTLHIIHSAKRASHEGAATKARSDAQTRSDMSDKIREDKKIYDEVVDIG